MPGGCGRLSNEQRNGRVNSSFLDFEDLSNLRAASPSHAHHAYTLLSWGDSSTTALMSRPLRGVRPCHGADSRLPRA
eukprot:15260831-Alexandrium_andersonii.AAC.1